jgi:lipopolysaccharide transport system permease protein
MTEPVRAVAAAAAETGPEPPATPTIRIRPGGALAPLRLREVWEYRELLYFLAWRTIKVRYKQTLLGMLWIVLQPVISVLVFSVLFGGLLGVPSAGVPYPIFACAALLPWNFFSASVSRGAQSLVANAHLITKVYFPRLIVPISGVLSGVVDFVVSCAVLGVLMIAYQVPVTWAVLWLPVFLLLAFLTALGFSLWLAALNVRYRDINYVVPFLLQTWMFLTPVIYGRALVPEGMRFLLELNPMTGVVEGFRWALLAGTSTGAQAPGAALAVSVAITLVVLLGGVVFFRTAERTFADIVKPP